MDYKIGLEAEFLYYQNGMLYFPPDGIPTDDFPIFGEIRGEPGNNVPEVVANFWKEYHLIQEKLRQTANKAKVPYQWLTTFEFRKLIDRTGYKKALKAMGVSKIEEQDKVINIHGTDITDHSDLVIESGKITGAYISCGLHVHFSAHSGNSYKEVVVPRTVRESVPAIDSSTVYLLSSRGDHGRVSVLTRPAIVEITKKMDAAFFKKYAVPAEECTKYRKAGYIELKDYGFEYRSLPATDQTIADLSIITEKAFKFLKEATEWH